MLSPDLHQYLYKYFFFHFKYYFSNTEGQIPNKAVSVFGSVLSPVINDKVPKIFVQLLYSYGQSQNI